jgi:hypothetical protein
MAPKVRYARSGDVHIAYAVIGDGPIDVVFVPGFVSNVTNNVDPERNPVHAAWFEHMSRFARVIVFDKRARDSATARSTLPASTYAWTTCVP